jgi:anaerobic magnesium-protoporphyrin IX monomethyl ester cyclase
VKICLITPPSGFLMDERVFMSLGILKVGAVLEQQGHEVDHLDLSGVENYEQAAADYRGAQVFAITATTPQLPAAVRIEDQLIGKVILGGPHATLVNAAAKRGSERAKREMERLVSIFDCVVAGDGEKAIHHALSEYGLIDADDPLSPLWNTSKDFTESPWPARHLVDVESYHYEVDGERALSMVTQLGCPFECGFCGGRFSPMLRRIRTRPAGSVTDEMYHLYVNYGVKGIMFYDDELNVNKGLIPLLKSIADMHIDWRLRGFVKAELFTEEQAEAMYAAGFRWLLCGFESAHPRILRNINKKATLEDNTRMLRIAHKYGLKVKALMSIGHPGESPETVHATKDWLLQEKPDDFDTTVITVYPGTPYYDSAKQYMSKTIYKYTINGDALYSQDMDFEENGGYYKGKPGEYRSYVWTDHLMCGEMETMRDELEHDCRKALGIPYPTSAAALHYEHSVGMNLHSSIIRGTHRLVL